MDCTGHTFKGRGEERKGCSSKQKFTTSLLSQHYLTVNPVLKILVKFPPYGQVHSITWQLNPLQKARGGDGEQGGGTHT